MKIEGREVSLERDWIDIGTSFVQFQSAGEKDYDLGDENDYAITIGYTIPQKGPMVNDDHYEYDTKVVTEICEAFRYGTKEDIKKIALLNIKGKTSNVRFICQCFIKGIKYGDYYRNS